MGTFVANETKNKGALTEQEAIVVSAVAGAVLIAVLLVGLVCLAGVCPTWR